MNKYRNLSVKVAITYSCPDCKGHGWIDDGDDCFACAGTGKVKETVELEELLKEMGVVFQQWSEE